MVVIKDPHNYMALDAIDLQHAINSGGKYTNPAGRIFTIEQSNGRNLFTISNGTTIVRSGEFVQTFWSVRSAHGEIARFENPFDAVWYKNTLFRSSEVIYITQIWE